MQNIDPVYFLDPLVVISFSLGLVVYWHHKRGLSRWVVLYSFVAYAGAIALKYVVQIPAVGLIDSAYGGHPVVLGVYYGTQTAVFEVGGAFLVAWVAVSRGRLRASDAEGYGLGLALWENGVLIALPLLVDYVAYYSVLSSPSSLAAQTLYPVLSKDAPSLFLGASGALPLVGYAILERVSSLLAHLSWGLLCVLAAVYRRKVYLAAALPIGFLIDFLTPFSQTLGIALFEWLVFAVAAGGLIIALAVTRAAHRYRAAG